MRELTAQAVRRRPADRRCPGQVRDQDRRRHRRRRPGLRGRPRRAPRRHRPAARAATSWSASMCGKVRHAVAAVAERLRLRRRPGHRGRRPHRHGRHHGARAPGRRRRRRPGAGRRRRRAVRRPRPGRRRWRSAPTACGSAPASSPPPRPAPCGLQGDAARPSPRTARSSAGPTPARPAGSCATTGRSTSRSTPRSCSRSRHQVVRLGAGRRQPPRRARRHRGRRAPRSSARAARASAPSTSWCRPATWSPAWWPRPKPCIDRLVRLRGSDDRTDSTVASILGHVADGRGPPTSCRRSTTTSRIPERVAGLRRRLGRARPHGRAPSSSSRGWCAAATIAGLTVEVARAARPHAGDRHRGARRSAAATRRRHRPALRPPRQAAGDDRLARRPRAVDAGASRATGSTAAAAPTTATPPSPRLAAIEAVQAGGRHPHPLRRAHRGQRGERQPRPPRPPRGAGRPHRHAQPRDLPRLRLLDYDRLWVTTSLRGLAGGTPARRHPARGRPLRRTPAASCRRRFRIARQLLDRIEDADHRADAACPSCTSRSPPTGCAEAADTAAELPPRRRPSSRSSPAPGPIDRRPGRAAAGPHVAADAVASSAPTACPPTTQAGNVLRPLDRAAALVPAAADLRRRTPRSPPSAAALTADPPYGARVTLRGPRGRPGLERAAVRAVAARRRCERGVAGRPSAQPARAFGEGGTIPFMGMLGERFPDAQFVITGVLGPDSNAHGPERVPPPADAASGSPPALAMVLDDHARR